MSLNLIYFKIKLTYFANYLGFVFCTKRQKSMKSIYKQATALGGEIMLATQTVVQTDLRI